MTTQRIERPLDNRQLAGLFRDVDWVAQRAVSLVAEGRAPSLRTDGPAPTALAHYLHQRGHFETVHDESRLARRMPTAHRAVQLHEEAPVTVRTMIHALTLAGQSAEQIAAWVGESAEVIVFYQRCLFDVGNRLRHSAFIIDRVIGLPLPGTGGEPSAPAVVKLLAWLSGPAAVALLFPTRKPHGTSLAELATMLTRRAKLLLDVTTLLDHRPIDAQRQQQVRQVLETIASSPGDYGDEDVPRSESEQLQAQRTALINLVFDRVRGTTSREQEANHVS